MVSLGVRWEDIHVIGGSLGGQAAGHVGHAVGGKVGRITALDPSGPLFHSERRKDRLDDTYGMARKILDVVQFLLLRQQQRRQQQ